MTANFASTARTQIVYITRSDGGNVLTSQSLTRALAIHARIVTTSWPNLKSDGTREIPDVPQPLKFTDVCLSSNATEGVPDGNALGCSMNNVLQVFSYNPIMWGTDAQVLEVLNTPSQWNSALTGRGFVLDSVLGGIVRDANGAVQSATTLSMLYLLAGNETLIEQELEDLPAQAWEQEYLDALEVRPSALLRRVITAGRCQCAIHARIPFRLPGVFVCH